MNDSHCHWLSPIFLKEQRDNLVQAFGSFFKEKHEDIPVLGMGLSGTMPLALVAAAKPNQAIGAIRKPDGSHSSNKVECSLASWKSYIILDDFTESCDTLAKIKEIAGKNCSHVLLYNMQYWHDGKEEKIKAVFPEVEIWTCDVSCSETKFVKR